MSSVQDLAAFRRVIEEAFNQQDYRVLYDVFETDFIEHQFGISPTIAGIQGDIDFLHKKFPDFRLRIDELAVAGDRVWARMTATGTNQGGFMGPPNGKRFEIAVFDEARFQNGKIVEHWGSPDRFALLAQLDRLPRPPEKVGSPVAVHS